MYTTPSDEVFEKGGLAGLLDPICEIAELYTSLSLSLSVSTLDMFETMIVPWLNVYMCMCMCCEI